jgi:hypothetical protein
MVFPIGEISAAEVCDHNHRIKVSSTLYGPIFEIVMQNLNNMGRHLFAEVMI